MSLSAESSFSAPAAEDSASNLASSSSSTPPTTVADSASLHSDISKHDVITVVEDAIIVSTSAGERSMLDRLSEPKPEPLPDLPSEREPEPGLVIKAASPSITPSPSRPRRSRASIDTPVYNLSRLSGTDGHGRRRANGDEIDEQRRQRRRTLAAAASLASSLPHATDSEESIVRAAEDAVQEGITALDMQWSPGNLKSPRTRRSAGNSPSSARSTSRTAPAKAPVPRVSSLGSRFSSMTRRGRQAVSDSADKISRELRRLQDTAEYKHVDEQPMVFTYWSRGKWIDPNEPQEPPARKKTKVAEEEPQEEEEEEPVAPVAKRRVKKYLAKGLYAGQDLPSDPLKGLTPAEKKKLSQFKELTPSEKINKTMPQPMYTGLRLLLEGRDFKLPYQVCNPLPPGQPKPDEWKKMTKNRFCGDSKEFWRKTPHLIDYQSKCVCRPEDGCGESCQNRTMLYECDNINCNVGKEFCTNRAFAELTARKSKGGKYRVGVEVIKTSDRGYGVRSNRCFQPNQIIMEYAGEIITEEECDRRMNEVYKDNECYYLMSFDQNMIIDATTGSIARFVNHSCAPNCRMIKWIVSGQPRMALFAGDRPIQTGDELTYDYNFDPFSAKNVQKCLCGAENCRGVLGPRKHEVKPVKAANLKTVVKATVKAGKRKLKEVIADSDKGGSAKKRKIQPATGLKKSVSTSSVQGAASALKKKVMSGKAKGSAKPRPTTTKAALALVQDTAKALAKSTKAATQKRSGKTSVVAKTTKRVVKTYKKSPATKVTKKATTKITVKAKGTKTSAATKKTAKATKATAKKTSPKKTPLKRLGTSASNARAAPKVAGSIATKQSKLPASMQVKKKQKQRAKPTLMLREEAALELGQEKQAAEITVASSA